MRGLVHQICQLGQPRFGTIWQCLLSATAARQHKIARKISLKLRRCDVGVVPIPDLIGDPAIAKSIKPEQQQP